MPPSPFRLLRRWPSLHGPGRRLSAWIGVVLASGGCATSLTERSPAGTLTSSKGAASLASAAPLPTLGSPRAKKGGTFRLVTGIAPETLNPISTHDNYGLIIMRWMAESLIARHEETYEWRPVLAEKFETAKDGRTFFFDVRKGVRFHDGSELTADDVKFSFDVYKTDLYASPEGNAVRELFEDVEIVSPNRVRIRAKRAIFSNLDFISAVPILPKAVYGDRSRKAKLSRTVVGTGPYRLTDYRYGARLEMERNPDWWGKGLPENAYKFNFDRIVAVFPQQEIVRLKMIEAGELDYAPLSYEALMKKTTGKPWGEKAFVEKATEQGLYTWHTGVYWNHARPLFKSLAVRRAMQLLFDRRSLNQRMRGGLQLLSTGPWHRLSEYADPGVKEVEYDPAQAKKLLAEDGWRDADGDGVLEKEIDGKAARLRFTLLYPKSDLEPLLTAYQEDLRKAGVRLDLQLTEWGLFLKATEERKFDAFMVGKGWPNVVDFDPTLEWHSRHASAWNTYAYANAAVDKLLDRFQAEPKRERRVALLREAFRIAAEDACHLFVFDDPFAAFGRTARLKIEKPSYKFRLGVDYWWLE